MVPSKMIKENILINMKFNLMFALPLSSFVPTRVGCVLSLTNFSLLKIMQHPENEMFMSIDMFQMKSLCYKFA